MYVAEIKSANTPHTSPAPTILDINKKKTKGARRQLRPLISLCIKEPRDLLRMFFLKIFNLFGHQKLSFHSNSELTKIKKKRIQAGTYKGAVW